ncbi:MAG: glycosyltransferase family 87 protein, partial [Gemmataceae bacterium]
MGTRTLPWIAVAAAAVACSAGFLGRRYSEWESVYIPAAARLWAGEPLYRANETYLYPPLASFLALPWLSLPPAAGRAAWFAVSALSVWTVLRLGWGLAGGSRRDESAGDWGAWAAGLACGGVFLQNSWSHQQTDVALAALQLAGLALLVRGRSLGAGALFGVAAALKCTPLLWMPYLVWRGRFAAAGLMLAVAAGTSLLPDLIARPPAGTWAGVYVARLAEHGQTAPLGVWGTDPLYNQSLAGTSLRALAVPAGPD